MLNARLSFKMRTSRLDWAFFWVIAESVEAMFSKFGEIKLVRLVAKGSTGRLPNWLTNDDCINTSANAFALVEFKKVGDAVRAVKVGCSLSDFCIRPAGLLRLRSMLI